MSRRGVPGARTLLAVVVGAVLTLTALALTTGAPGLDAATEPGLDTSPEPPPNTASADRGDLTESIETVGALSNGESWPAAIDAQGVVTQRHPEGTVVAPGEPLIWIGGRPVTLARGETPMYRELSLTRDRENKRLQGTDVSQLQEFLISAGFDDKGRLTPDGEFGAGTRRAVLAWQKANGLDPSGTVDRSQLVFHPTALRIAAEPRLGSTFSELTVEESAQQLTASLDPKQRNFVEVGGEVTLDPGTGATTTGHVTEVETIVGESGGREVRIRIAPDTPIGPDTERLNVIVERTVITDATIVPVLAVLALSGGGYGVEVVTEAGPELRAIEILDVVDDLAAVTGDVEPGDELVVPTEIGGGSDSETEADADTAPNTTETDPGTAPNTTEADAGSGGDS